jgi:hypothetical protein
VTTRKPKPLTITGDPREAELRAEIQARSDELSEIVERYERAQAKPIIGKCFKYLNRDSGGDTWWMFLRVTAHEHGTRFQTLKFEAQSGGWNIVVIDDGAYLNDAAQRGYIEITRRSFDREYAKFLGRLEQLNARARK